MKDFDSVKKLLVAAATNQTINYDSNSWTGQDCDVAAREAIVTELGKDYRSYRENKNMIFRLIEETIDLVLPTRVYASLGAFADVRTFGNNDTIKFRYKVGQGRGRAYAIRLAPGGKAEFFRLDEKDLTMNADSRGVAGLIRLEDYLDGKVSMAEIMTIVLQSLEDQIFMDIQLMLLGTATQARPASTVYSTASFSETAMKAAIRVAGAYGNGSATIFCTLEFAQTMTPTGFVTTQATPYAPSRDARDIAEARDRGWFGKWWGADVVVLPNGFTDESNTEFVLDPKIAYVFPSSSMFPDGKVVKIGFQGDAIIKEYENRDGSMELQMYKKMVVGVVGALNSWCIVENRGLVADWENNVWTNISETDLPA
jgi:hypothetical protein